MGEAPEHVVRNRAAWNQLAADYEEDGRRNWAQAEPAWGVWGVPEAGRRTIWSSSISPTAI
jgi:hypothetical protein